jgi:hypothetical protein
MAAGFRAPTLLRFTAQVEATLPHANPAPCFWIILPGKRMRRAESGLGATEKTTRAPSRRFRTAFLRTAHLSWCRVL